MSSFTEPLVVSKLKDGLWQTHRAFRYYIGVEGGPDFVDVPEEFITDFASVPRALWAILPPDGKYTQAAVLHDWLYYTQERTRKQSDDIFLEAMGVLGVSWWKKHTMHRAVRIFGWIPWKKRKK